MSQSGKKNSNYKTGLYCTKHYCSCGKERDYRAKQCIDCRLADKDKIISLLYKAHSFLHLAELAASTRSTVTRVVKNSGLDYSHFRPGRGRFADQAEMLSRGSTIRYGTIKNLVIREGLLKNVCTLCGQLPHWNHMPLVLHLDHINGDPTDNRLENLRFLCPNCHTQTDTYTGKNSYGTAKRRK